MSPLVLRVRGYRLYFFSREERRPHVHVQHPTGEAKVWSTRMKSARRGTGTSRVDVTNVSRDGFSVVIGRKKRFVRFEDFPWFQDASITQITNVTLPSPHHLYWPELDIDLAVDSLDHPGRYPLVSRVPAAARARSLVKEGRKAYKAKRRGRG